MKYLILILLTLSCSQTTYRKDIDIVNTVMINTVLYKNDVKVESVKAIVKLNETATIKKEKHSSNSVFSFSAKKSTKSKKYSLFINTKIIHRSLQRGKIKIYQDFMVEPNRQLEYEYTDKANDKFRINLIAKIIE